MNALQTFAFRDNSVRIVTIDGNPWFVANDVCRCLGLSLQNGGAVRYLQSINDDEKRVVTRRDCLEIFEGVRAPSYVLISESGLYKLILRSHPNANPVVRQFQDWVTREVLPSIRKDGGYIAGQEKVRSGEMDEDAFVLKAMEILNRKVQRLQDERDKLAARRPSRCRLLEVYGCGAG